MDKEYFKASVSRRGFLSRMAVGGLAVAGLTGLTVGCGDSREDASDPYRTNTGNNNNNNGGNGGGGGGGGNNPPPVVYADPQNFPGIPGQTVDVVVLNFALTLEYLEADLYRQALNLASGLPLDRPLAANGNSYTQSVADGSLGDRGDAGYLYLQQYAYVEQAHVNFLRTTIPTLGGTPVSPNPGGYQADFGNTLQSILTTIRTLEEEGVRAYLGAAGFLSTLPLIQTASTIYSTEARHSAAINYVLGLPIGPEKMPGDQMVVPAYPSENTFEYFRTPRQVIQDIQPFLV